MSGMKLLLVVIAVFVAILQSTQALQFPLFLGSDNAELSLDPGKLDESSRIEVRGVNTGSTAATIVIQMDDRPGTAYWNRVNQEREVRPGAFSFELPIGGLSTPSGRPVTPGNLKRIAVFPGGEGSGIEQVSIQVLPSATLPDGAFGWDFGPRRAAIFPGFEKITPDDTRVSGRKLSAIQRPSGDALISDGIRGIERFEAAVANGHYRATLWTEDYGEWQTLPYWTRRRISLNGDVIREEHLSAEEWVQGVYLAGGGREALVDGDAWALHGSRRGGVVQADVRVDHGILSVELEGDLPASRFLAGLLVEPLQDDAPVFRAVTGHRKRLFQQKWVEVVPQEEAWLSGRYDPGQTEPLVHEDVVLARGDSSFHERWLDVPGEVSMASIEIEHDTDWPAGLKLSLWYGFWQFERVTPSGTALSIIPTRLIPITHAVPSAAPLRRKLYFRLKSTEENEPGVYKATIVALMREKPIRIPVTVTVLDVALPHPEKAIGTYLEEAPHRGWFGNLAAGREEAVTCDLQTLLDLGITSVSPPFTAPRHPFIDRHVSMKKRLNELGFGPRTMAYASVKWSIRDDGLSQTLENVRTTNRILQETGYGDILWSIIDEPRNDGPDYQEEKTLIGTVRRMAPSAKLAGHVNHPDDWEVASLVDVALINSGYGVSTRSIARLSAAGVEPWLYNMERPRLAGGVYLWRSGAEGYLQWHARMPTADPFDPTDGREGDFQFLYPSHAPCIDPEIHRDLIELSEGIQDLRWLLWLEDGARTDEAAMDLLLEIRASVPSQWESARKLDGSEIAKIRDLIRSFARNR